MDHSHLESFRRRSEDERRAAADAGDPATARAHAELAEKYAALVQAYEELARLNAGKGTGA